MIFYNYSLDFVLFSNLFFILILCRFVVDDGQVRF